MAQWEATAMARKMSMRGLSRSPVWSGEQTSQPTDIKCVSGSMVMPSGRGGSYVRTRKGEAGKRAGDLSDKSH